MTTVLVLCAIASVGFAVGEEARGASDCPALTSTPGQLVVCHHGDEQVNCSLPAVAGTSATVTCHPSYELARRTTTRTRTTCGPSGSWSQRLTSCQLSGDCGRQSDYKLIVNGESVVGGHLPWHVNIHGGGQPTAGTLISPSYVVTAALWVSVLGHTDTPLPASQFTLTAGQLVRDSTPAEEPHSQTRGVQTILLHPQYDGAAHDIALLVADASFVITPAVNVACVDWSGLFQAPTASDVIIVAAYKLGTYNSDHIVTATQLYTPVARQQCRERTASNRRSLIRDDVFCAEPTNNATCHEYTGAGLVVERATGGARRYYLTGVNGVKLAYTFSYPGCFYNRLNGFADVLQQISWLKQHVSPPA